MKRMYWLSAIAVTTLIVGSGFSFNNNNVAFAAQDSNEQMQEDQPAAPKGPVRTQKRERRERQPKRGPLAGPDMGEHPPTPGVPMGFSESGPGRRYVDRTANPRIYRRILRDIELTAEQEEAIRDIFTRFAEETRAYYEPLRDEIQRLNQVARPNAARGGNANRRAAPSDRARPNATPDEMQPPPSGTTDQPRARDRQRGRDRATDRAPRPGQADAPPNDQSQTQSPSRAGPQRLRDSDDPEVQRAVTRLREINAGKPSAEPYLLEVWQVLTPEQQEAFEAKTEELREQERTRNLERNGLPGEAEMMAPPPPGQETDRGDRQARRQRYFEELLKKEEGTLTEREKRILERLRRRDAEGQRARRRPIAPPPSAEDIEFNKQPPPPPAPADNDGG